MKLTKFVEYEAETEIEVSIEDVAAVINESPDSLRHVLSGINNIYTFLAAVPDELINEMTPEQKKLIRNYLSAQAKRFEA